MIEHDSGQKKAFSFFLTKLDKKPKRTSGRLQPDEIQKIGVELSLSGQTASGKKKGAKNNTHELY